MRVFQQQLRRNGVAGLRNSTQSGPQAEGRMALQQWFSIRVHVWTLVSGRRAGGEGVLLASPGWRPEMLLTTLYVQDAPTAKTDQTQSH